MKMQVYLKSNKYDIKPHDVYISKKDGLLFVVTSIKQKKVVINHCDFGFKILTKEELNKNYLRINSIDHNA